MGPVHKIGSLIYAFQTFRKINIATLLYKKSSKSLLHSWIYFVIPILVFSGNIFILISDNVLYKPNHKFTYLNDLSNSLCLPLLYFLSYFLSGYFPLKFDEFIKKGISKELLRDVSKCMKDKKQSNLSLIFIGIVLSGIGFGAGYSFYNVAKSNTSAYWINGLSDIGKKYYCMFLGLTWYHSLSLLGMALTSGFIVYWTIKSKKINYINSDFNKNISIISAVDIVFSTFSYGLFYIIGAFLFIFNDRIAEKYKVYNTFHKDIPSFVLVLCITLLVILVYLPLQELLIFMKSKKDHLIKDINEDISKESSFDKREQLLLKRNDLIKQNLIYTSLTNKIVFILSVLIPSIGVIFQGIELFKK